MIDPTIEPRFWDFILFGVFVALMPTWTAFVTLPRIRKLPEAEINRIRPRLYIESIALQWVMAAIALHPLFLRGTSTADLGLAVELQMLPRFAGGAVLVIVGLLALYWQRRRIMQAPDGRELVREAVKKFSWLLPRTQFERVLWIVVSLHAGVCEELFFRGYVFGVLNHIGPWWAAGIVGSLMFGMGHSYQGVRGVASTAVIGMLAIGLYLLTGSLWVGMFAHAVYDMQGGEFGRWALYGKDNPAPSHA
ncbi:MAG: CPBP family intramembrane metalloprotease [Planctomycetes bacterium]|nr:CPBP family intramembrane metalloprotease [Planctomycetota bacterium]